MEKNAQSGHRLVLVPCPFQGHIYPMLKLFFEQCLIDRVIEQEPQNKIICIIYDGIMYFSESVANYLNIPSILLRTQSAINFIALNPLLRLHSKGHTPFRESMSLNRVPELHPLRICPPPFSKHLKNYLKLVANLQKVRTSSAVIWNTMDCLEQSSLARIQKEFQVPIFTVGPLHKIATAASSSLLEEDTGCIVWLDKQSHNSVIYKELAEMAWGLANSKQPFLWVIRPGSICGSDWIELLPQEFIEAVGERGCILKWAPQMDFGALWEQISPQEYSVRKILLSSSPPLSPCKIEQIRGPYSGGVGQKPSDA
ncbi:LOW QUALITY PROTEIN: hypothetical protein PRUPE_6G007900 [Prunus persica]|uniref:Uncharacterized protein n=1 Tax=Prunus persica TaxID=3760 RepID=A0A251NIB9_PRUPE|nr:LOW QUALITY PROTEIN: hypothetical protein PRUPE_6G007900 [Prunus persica]